MKLNKVGQAYYDKLMDYIRSNSIYQNIDETLVEQAAIWWQIYVESYEGIQRDGTTVRYASGHRQVSPDVTNLNKAQVQLNDLLDRLGVGEKARQRLKILEPADSNDPMDLI